MNTLDIQITTPEHVQLRYSLAGLGSRGAALLIDMLTLMAAYFACLWLFVWLMSDMFFYTSLAFTRTVIIVLFILLNFAVLWGYFALFEFLSKGRTLGKMALGIRVVQENGQSITFLSACIRNLIRIIDFLPAFFFVGILTIFLHPRHKRLGDLASGTIVVYDRKRRKRQTFEMVLAKRFGFVAPLSLDDWKKQAFTPRDWQLLKTYLERQTMKTRSSHRSVTGQVASILLPKADIDPQGKNEWELERDLFTLYLALKEEFF